MNLLETVVPFSKVEYIQNPNGYIVWRMGTGGNTELLHIRTIERGRGTGCELIRQMVLKLNENPPYATVFGFTRISNKSAHSFYRGLGFDLSTVTGVYGDGEAVLFSQPFERLRARYAH